MSKSLLPLFPLTFLFAGLFRILSFEQSQPVSLNPGGRVIVLFSLPVLNILMLFDQGLDMVTFNFLVKPLLILLS